MRWWPVRQWKRWRASRRGAHRAGAVRQGMAAHPALSVELDAARQRLARVDALAPAVDELASRIQVRLNRNHIGPIFDAALGLGPPVRGRKP